ncbi:MAG: hypothetical protein HN726_04700 [Candidatus Magasanikbacteria bacterium]|jgi:hypothetical protein|nr:hypothetical protein [Candidatus Magasanikbacteria bacterium]
MIELSDIRSRVVNLLQDKTFVRWTKTELNNYIHDALLDLIRTIRLPVADSDVTISSTAYSISLPSSLMDISGGSIAGRELPVVTTSEMKRLSSEGKLPVVIKDGEYSVTQIFGNPLWNSVEDWRITSGTPQALVLDQRSSETVRIWPIPVDEVTLTLTGTLRPVRMSDEVPYTYTDDSDSYYPVTRTIVTALNGWVTGDTLFDDANRSLVFDEVAGTIAEGTDDVFSLLASDYITTCAIDAVWVDALTYGTLERAYLKEHDLRNVEKSEYFRKKKMTMIVDANDVEPLNPASISGGVNFNRLVVRR